MGSVIGLCRFAGSILLSSLKSDGEVLAVLEIWLIDSSVEGFTLEKVAVTGDETGCRGLGSSLWLLMKQT